MLLYFSLFAEDWEMGQRSPPHIIGRLCCSAHTMNSFLPLSVKILDIEPGNVKSLYRRGVANMQLGNLEEAKDDLQNAQQLSPSGTAWTILNYRHCIYSLLQMSA